MNEIEVNSKPQRAQGGKGLLSHTISVQSIQESMPLILEKRGEDKNTREKEKERAALLLAVCLCAGAGVGREREGRVFVLPTHSRLKD